MSKIREAFKNGKAFIPFLTAGDPSLDKTAEFIVSCHPVDIFPKHQTDTWGTNCFLWT